MDSAPTHSHRGPARASVPSRRRLTPTVDSVTKTVAAQLARRHPALPKRAVPWALVAVSHGPGRRVCLFVALLLLLWMDGRQTGVHAARRSKAIGNRCSAPRRGETGVVLALALWSVVYTLYTYGRVCEDIGRGGWDLRRSTPSPCSQPPFISYAHDGPRHWPEVCAPMRPRSARQ